MKHLKVVIPTRNRLEKLHKTIESIPECDFISIAVVCDGDESTYNKLLQMSRNNLFPVLVKEHKGSVFCRNQETSRAEDGVLYATDDIIFTPDSIQKAFSLFNDSFKDDDGVVGFVQTPAGFQPTGIALVGNAFLNRYPGKQLFFPEYYHFAAQEIHWLSYKLGKFEQCKEAVVEHYNPMIWRKLMDQTHKDAREMRNEDMRLIASRKKLRMIWGEV